MAHQEYLKLLKSGVVQWNKWREEHPEIQPNLSGANLNNADLSGADLSGTMLCSTSLRGANLSSSNLSSANLVTMYPVLVLGDTKRLKGVNLSNANLKYANLRTVHTPLADGDIWLDLSGIDLSNASLEEAGLSGAKLKGANLQGAYLRGADLRGTDLSDANLINTDLIEANLSHANLSHANLRGASVRDTVFADVDLRATKGLIELKHFGSSAVTLNTIQLPSDESALHFLRGVGISDEWINFYRSTTMHPIQYYSCFISYSSKDDVLARRLYADLQAQGVRCWFASEDMKIGDKIRSRIDEAIYQQNKLLLLLSAYSISSSWVEDEVEAALEKEHRLHREVLFPVRLDDTVMHTSQAWAATLRRTRHIGDFTEWADPQAYQTAFDRLLRDLKQD